MCSICGMLDFHSKVSRELTEKMSKTMKHRGIDCDGVFEFKNGCFAHNRLSVIDLENGKQPMTRIVNGKKYTICYNGEIYNTDELKFELEKKGAIFSTSSDTEALLFSYIFYGEKCVSHLNGIFAFAIYDEAESKLFIARDRFGIKPFFYCFDGSTFIFASEIKALLENPNIRPDVDEKGLWQLLFLAPCTLEGYTVFANIKELKPAECGFFSGDGLSLKKYWYLEPKHLDITASQAAETVGCLLYDAVSRQLVSDVPLCTFLSGGLDSSAITAIASREYVKKGRILSTYSFEYEGNKENFKKSLFQPQGDDEYAVYLGDWLGTDHTVLQVPNDTVARYLTNAVDYRDFPGQADIDSSLLYFCEQVKRHHTVAMSGECSDEIFGGYPWFYRPEMLYSDFYPFIHDPFARVNLFKQSVTNAKDGYEFLSKQYKRDIESVELLDTDNEQMKTSRIATNLSVKYFMTNLLERKDRMSMASSLEVRVPFADHRILEYVYNVPWEIKFENKVEKALLRNAVQNLLPEKILCRKKSPYPKTHNPLYLKLVAEMLEKRINSDSPICNLLDMTKFEKMRSQENITWFGQLMGKPQLLAWLLQFDYFLEKYDVNLI